MRGRFASLGLLTLLIAICGCGWWAEGPERGTWVGTRDWVVGVIAAAGGLWLVAHRSRTTGLALLALSIGWFVGTAAASDSSDELRLVLLHRPLLLTALTAPALVRRRRSIPAGCLLACVWAAWILGRFPSRNGPTAAAAVCLLFGAAKIARPRVQRAVCWYAAWAIPLIWMIVDRSTDVGFRWRLPAYEAAVLAIIVLLVAATSPLSSAPERTVAIDLGLLAGRRRPGDVRLSIVDQAAPGSGVLDVDGTCVVVEHDGVDPIPVTDGLRRSAALLVAHRRLTDRVQAQASAVEASRDRLLVTMEHEQATFEREVRTLVMPRLERLTRELPTDAGTARIVLAELISDLDAVCGGATPPAIDDGLVAALRQLATTSPVPASSDVDLLWVPPHIERILWYVAAEAVANAVKHAGATSITIEAFDDSELVTLRVTDDGRGGAAFELGSGLSGLRSRVARAGGDLTIESPIGNGTAITACVPRA